MASALDLRMEKAMAALTADGAPLALTSVPTRFGVDVPAFAAAPPSLGAYFDHFCALHGDAPFLVSGDERLSFAETHRLARAAAVALAGRFGVRKGDRVAIAARNGSPWIILYMAILMAGGVATLLNAWWQGDELADGLDDAGVTLAFADPSRVHRLAGCRRALAARIVAIDMDLPAATALVPVLAGAAGQAGILPEIGPDDDATILFTSGSTGRSKGALSDHRAVVQGTLNYLAQTLMMLQIITEDGEGPINPPATLLTLPLFHVTAEIPILLQSFAQGRKLVLTPKWDTVEAMRLIEAEKITYFVGVPLMSFEIMIHPDRAKYDLSSCRDFAAGGAPRPVEHVGRLSSEMGAAKPLIGYGLTETNAVGCGNFRENYRAKPDSTGRASTPLVELAIVDDAGRAVPQGERGEIAFRTICNFKEYWHNEAATRAAFTPDGFFRTGDIGYLDADDYLFIVDRKKDIIIRGGENISCQEVEAALYAHPDIAEAAVFGLPDARLGETPGAVVHARDGAGLDATALCDFLKGRLAAFKVPSRIWIDPSPLPRLGTEKIDKVALKAKYRAMTNP